ncbi:YceI family protein [Parafilimonas sp.]|uniref:YceI family protein n=1 Tax=Parafilimonas sp. TaxID=1969739 RepID=UPI0039E2F349
MKTICTAIILLTGFFTLKAQQYKPVDDKSEVKFTIKNFGINTNGTLNGLKGTIKFDPANLAASSFDVSVDVNTINTGVDGRDSHLKQDEYFNVAKYSVIRFISTSIEKNGEDYAAKGNLTIKGITKPMSIPFTVKQNGEGLIFSGGFNINRKDFGVGGSSAVMGSEVNVSLKVFTVKE